MFIFFGYVFVTYFNCFSYAFLDILAIRNRNDRLDKKAEEEMEGESQVLVTAGELADLPQLKTIKVVHKQIYLNKPCICFPFLIYRLILGIISFQEPFVTVMFDKEQKQLFLDNHVKESLLGAGTKREAARILLRSLHSVKDLRVMTRTGQK